MVNNNSLIRQPDKDLIIFDSKDHITFLTNKVDTNLHSHNYIQVTIGLEKDFHITVGKDSYYVNGMILDSNIAHKLNGFNEWQLYLLINPESVFGEKVKRSFLQERQVYVLEELRLGNMIQSILEMNTVEDYKIILMRLKKVLGIVNNVKYTFDGRIQKVLHYIETYPLERLSVKELSNLIYLSESRLSHLFKDEMGISITSYILHEKIKKAFYLIFNGQSITDASIEAGFSSSSHFTRSVREKLGMTPRAITKNSRYLQV